MSAKDVIAEAIHGAIDDYAQTDAWPIAGDDVRAADYLAAIVEATVHGMSVEDLADLLRNRTRQMVLTIDVMLDGKKVAEAVRCFGGSR